MVGWIEGESVREITRQKDKLKRYEDRDMEG